MNSIHYIDQLIDEKNLDIYNSLLKEIWNDVWCEKSIKSYSANRIYKTIDKINTLIQRGVNFHNKNVLDIGCGDGSTLKYLSDQFYISGTGVDISNYAVNQLRKNFINHNNLSFLSGDHRDLRMIETDSFDIVLSWGVIEHFDNYYLAVAEARRVLKKDGILILIQPHLLSFGVVQELVLKITGRWRFGKQKDFSVFRYRNILKQSGFNHINTFTKIPYQDMKYTRVLDGIFHKILPIWGHYLYIVAKK